MLIVFLDYIMEVGILVPSLGCHGMCEALRGNNNTPGELLQSKTHKQILSISAIIGEITIIKL